MFQKVGNKRFLQRSLSNKSDPESVHAEPGTNERFYEIHTSHLDAFQEKCVENRV